ncbi:MAG: hypothetical protein ABWZ99_08550 [Ilumatobacteraceae bacterium]
MALPEVGDRFIGPSGRIWTVQSIARRAKRIVLTRPADDGLAAAIVDLGALGRMVSLRRATSVVPAVERPAVAPLPRLRAPTLHHVARERHPHPGCHGRRRMLIHLRFDEDHHAHVDTYETLPA